jgi:hypothetical protein
MVSSHASGISLHLLFLLFCCAGVNRAPWTAADDVAMEAHHAQLGPRWVEIGRRMGRCENLVKNRWYTKHREGKKSGSGARGA